MQQPAKMQIEQETGGILLSWRVIIFVLALLSVIMGAIAMSNNYAKEHLKDWGCPLFPSPDSLYSRGRSVGYGEACMYRDNGTWPVCFNSRLPESSEDYELRCVRHKCSTRLEDGADCGMDGKGHSEWCQSEICAQQLYGAEQGRWTCRSKHFRAHAGSSCETSDWCPQSMFCTGAKECRERPAADAPCQIEDVSVQGEPPAESSQCQKGSYCMRRTGSGPLLCTPKSWGNTGTPCAFAPGETRPLCMRGQRYCSAAGVCEALILAGGDCRYYYNQPAAMSDAQCQVNYGCYADLPGALPTAPEASIGGKCRRLLSFGDGEASSMQRFCRPGLVLDQGFCAEPRREGDPCAADAECGAGLICGCGNKMTDNKPGKCMKVPLRLPAASDALPNDFPAECAGEFAALVGWMTQWPKHVDSENEGGYTVRKGELETEALCCMKHHSRLWSHASLIGRMYLTNPADADVSCNDDITWVWVVLGITGSATIFGVCTLICGLIDPKDEPTSDVADLPYGQQSPGAQQNSPLAPEKPRGPAAIDSCSPYAGVFGGTGPTAHG
eukprot:TRINITY_DN11444_c0_g1_i2.p1 TRINITY_DN11444_c0_g1~~TRINITY_DN11444_c0_g1_i2.p1  ORF type:complete len:588 (+),score=182.45 TRINITY_DN11444_c0_g1_i2:101-1765(+)